jgi:hypothetical protein
MIKQLCGSFTFHGGELTSPDVLVLLLTEGTVLELVKNIHHYDFILKSETLKSECDYNTLIDICAISIGFLINLPTFESYANSLSETACLYNPENLKETILFECIESELKRVEGQGLKFMETRRILNLRRTYIEQFINQLNSNEILVSAILYYLEAIDEPGLYLVSLYKAYEVLKDRHAFSNTAAKKFTRLANTTSSPMARHAPETKRGIVKSFSQADFKFCGDFIKAGITHYAESCFATVNQ